MEPGLVAFMMHASSSGGLCSGKAQVVEITGPAGAGKTTLYQALDRYTEFIRLGNFPDVRNASDAPFFILNGMRLIPSLVPLYRFNSRQLTRREFAWMTILYGWPALLGRESNDGAKAIILDQGPIYLLAEMQLYGPDYLLQRAAKELWQNLYDRWSSTLNRVVWLDADNDILLDRIRNRRQEHIVKREAAAVIYQFLDRYRAAYEFLFSMLTAKKHELRILRFDTGRQQPQDLVNQLFSELSC
jgi:hypothetical protein